MLVAREHHPPGAAVERCDRERAADTRDRVGKVGVEQPREGRKVPLPRVVGPAAEVSVVENLAVRNQNHAVPGIERLISPGVARDAEARGAEREGPPRDRPRLVGPAVPAGRSLGLIDMRDIATTLARRLDLSLPAAEGKVLLP